MIKFSTTKLTSKGQVVIPEDIRERLGLNPGTQFIVMGQDDAVIFKIISPPAKGELTKLLNNARKQARQSGLKPADVENAVKKARSKK